MPKNLPDHLLADEALILAIQHLLASWRLPARLVLATTTSIEALRGVESMMMTWFERRAEKDIAKFLARKSFDDIHIGKELYRRMRGMMSRRVAGRLAEDIPVQALKDIYPESCHQPVFGLDLYRVIARSRVALNIHGDRANNNVTNIRMFDSTGVGACLLTDRGANMANLFKEDSEVVVYSSIDECVEKAKYLLDHEDERREIAQAGHRRTMADHTVLSRCENIHSVILDRLREGSRVVSNRVTRQLKIRLSLVIPDSGSADLFLDYTISSILSDVNVCALRNAGHTLIVYCATGLKEKISGSKQYVKLSEIMSIRIEEIEGDGMGDSLIVSKLHTVAMREALENKDIFFCWNRARYSAMELLKECSIWPTRES